MNPTASIYLEAQFTALFCLSHQPTGMGALWAEVGYMGLGNNNVKYKLTFYPSCGGSQQATPQDVPPWYEVPLS